MCSCWDALKHSTRCCCRFVLVVLADSAANTKINIPNDRQTHNNSAWLEVEHTEKTAVQEAAATEVYSVWEAKGMQTVLRIKRKQTPTQRHSLGSCSRSKSEHIDVELKWGSIRLIHIKGQHLSAAVISHLYINYNPDELISLSSWHTETLKLRLNSSNHSGTFNCLYSHLKAFTLM